MPQNLTKPKRLLKPHKLKQKSQEFAQAHSSKHNKGKGSKCGEPDTTPSALAIVKENQESAMKALEAAKLTINTAGAKAFELYGNLLSNEAR